jgi:hypothetical protein
MLKEEGKFRMSYFMGRQALASLSLKKNKEIGGLTSYQEAAIKYQASKLLNPSPKSFSSLTGAKCSLNEAKSSLTNAKCSLTDFKFSRVRPNVP